MAGYLTVTDDFNLTERGKRVIAKAGFATTAQIGTPATQPLVVVGDSHASNWAPYSSTLGSALGRSVDNEGISGQQSVDISARQGGVPPLATAAGNLVPASGSVAVTFLNGIRPLRSVGSLTRPAIFGGVAGTLGTTDGGLTYTFTRTTAGYAVPIPSEGSPFVMGTQHRDKLLILLAPRNDVGRDEAAVIWRATLEEIIARYKAMTAWGAPTGRFLLLSMLPWTNESAAGKTARVQANTALRDLFPQQWLDWAAWLRSDAAFTAAGITKTAQDTTDIAAGYTPASFRVDEGHLNGTGYAAVNALISLAVTARGW